MLKLQSQASAPSTAVEPGWRLPVPKRQAVANGELLLCDTPANRWVEIES